MAKEKFLIVASPIPDDCFSRFSETENRQAISDGTADPDDAYSWIEGSFSIQLVRDKEATHLCSFTPSAYFIWLQNAFAGQMNEKWLDDGDPEGLEHEAGGEYHGYDTYRDTYDPRFICETFIIDTMKDLDEPLRKPRDSRSEAGEAYHSAIWKAAEEVASELGSNGAFDAAPILNALEFRRWEKEQAEKSRQYHAPIPYGSKEALDNPFRL